MKTKMLISLIVLSSVVKAQIIHPPTVPHVFPPTPQTQIFEKYLNHAVTQYNGLPEISIPLYSIELNGIKIPIVLSYYAGGIKYKKYDGDIGAGWSINAGGYRVSRTIYGKPDELFALYNPTTLGSLQGPERDGYLGSISLDNNSSGEIINQLANNNTYLDGEYDHFTYNMPTTNGKFLISNRATKSVDFANANQDKVILDENSNLVLNDIKVIDNSGNQFFAGGLQSNNDLLVERSRANNQYKTAWPIYKIRTAFNKQIDFSYDLYEVDMNRESYYVYKIIDATVMDYWQGDNWSASNNVNVADPEEHTNIVENMFFIKKIQTENETVEFKRSPGSEVLSQIVVRNVNNDTVLIVNFSYEDSEGHRLLTGLSINDKSYAFNYYDPPANMMYSFPDQWGFYKYSFTGGDYFGLFLPEEFKSHQFIEASTMPSAFLTTKTIGSSLNYLYPQWINREVNENPHYFSLKSITFPTGGKTTYEYEPNQYRASYTNNPADPIIKGGGQRIKRIISTASDGDLPVITRYKYGENEDGNGKVDYSYLNNIKTRFFQETHSYNPEVEDPNHYYEGYTMNTIRSYCTQPLESDIDMDAPIQYSKVAVYKERYDSTNLGKTVSTYDIPYEFNLSNWSYNPVTALSNDYYRLGVGSYLLGKSPTLLSTSYYDKSNQLIQKEEYTYYPISTGTYYGLKVKQKAFLSVYPNSTPSILKSRVYSILSTYFQELSTFTQFYSSKPSTKTTKYFVANDSLVVKDSFGYNSLNQLIYTGTNNSKDEQMYVVQRYPYEMQSVSSPNVYNEMVQKNILAPIIQQTSFKGSTQIQRVTKHFSKWYSGWNVSNSNSIYVTRTIEDELLNNAPETVIRFHGYDNDGNILSASKENDVKSSYIWGYNNQYPVAQISNADPKDVYYTSFEEGEGNSAEGDSRCGRKSRTGSFSKFLSGLSNTSYVLSYWLKSGTTWSLQKSVVTVTTGSYTISVTGQIDDVRFYPVNSQIVTRTYIPLVGISSQTDINDKTTFYEYDNFGRLRTVRDQDRNVIKVIEYKFQATPQN